MAYLEEYKRWLNEALDTALLEELKGIENNEDEIKLRFFNSMQFGTAGLRSVTGAGISRMNIYTVGKTTQGLCDYINSEYKAGDGMIVAYDSRISSDEFAKRTCEVLAANKVKTYIFDGIASVPELSFAIRHLKTFGGIMITASHNPKEYNGYKVYAAYGGQLSIEASNRVTEYAAKVDIFKTVKSIKFEDGIKDGNIILIKEDIREKYYQKLLSLVTSKKEIEQYADSIRAVYTPLYGAGLRTIKNVLPRIGIKHVYIVEEQAVNDGLFPTVKMPNPEDKTAMTLAITLAEEKDADVAMGTDPDADRMGAAIRSKDHEFKMLTGNQIGCLLLSHILEKRKKEGKKGGFIVKSLVSTNMANEIAEAYGVPCYDVLTGFRFISELATEKEAIGEEFIFGFEESYGYLAGNFVRDKDGPMAALLLLEALCCWRAEGKSISEKLQSLFEQFGYFAEGIESKVFTGLNGMDEMKAVMNALRTKNITEIADLLIDNIEDYLSGYRIYSNDEKEKINLPVSDVLKFNLADGSWIAVRPSGTEPKLKVYFNVKAKSENKVKDTLQKLKTGFMQLIS